MSKTILAQVDGWTPVIDGVVDDVGAIPALVFGKMWRYCQMADGVCKASQDRIAKELGMSRQTINAHVEKLVQAGYMQDMTPDLAGLPHEYRDTGKANLSINLTGSSQKSLQVGVKKFDTKKEVKKESIEINNNEELFSKAFQAYTNNIAALTAMSSESLHDMCNMYSPEWVIDAVKVAVERNARNLKYIGAVLQSWKEKGKDWKPGENKKPQAARSYPQYPTEQIRRPKGRNVDSL